MLRTLGLLVLVLCVTWSDSKASRPRIRRPRQHVRNFPDGFLFGTATASYQIEGAWDEDGKSENIWDRLSHTEPCAIQECHTGDVAADSYHNVERDVEMMRELGLDFYRFSLSWSRILPTSFLDKINEAGVQYYNNLINEMLKYNIQPMITLYHWDLPQKLQDMGGWTNPYIIDWFADYARTAFTLYGDRVKYWITFNEPREVCYQGYGALSLAPLLDLKGRGDYMCAKNLLLAHAKAYHIYNEEFRPAEGGKIGLTLNAFSYEPESDGDEEAVEIARVFNWKLYTDPIFSASGNFPSKMIEMVAAKSAAQGYSRSRLPEFTPAEVEYVRGTSDFIGLNHYTTYKVYKNETSYVYDSPSMDDDMDIITYQPSDWTESASSWLKVTPWGIYDLLTYIQQEYSNPTVFITENGLSSSGGLSDDDRVFYYREYLGAVLDAIEDGADVQMYAAWSLMDNFEWMQGYTERFGLYEVDFSSPQRTRTPRKSAFVYKEIVRTRALDPTYEPDTTTMSIDEGN